MEIKRGHKNRFLMNLWVYIISMFSSRKKGDYIPRIFYFYMMIITVGSSYVALLLYRSHTATVFSISILLLFHMVFIEIYLRINEHFLMEQEKEIYMRQLALNESSVSQQRHSLQEFYAERQQLIEKLLLIKKDIEQGRMATVEEDLESFIHNGLPSDTISNCGNSTIDSVINFKHAAAKEYGIAFDLKLFVSTQLPFEPCDLGILIGNALDNAIEATKQCTRAEKTIHVSMQIKKESFIMVMKNPFEGELKKDPEGRLLTTGKHPQRHGYGLRSIMRIAEKYDGETIIRNDNGCFVLTVILNLNLSGDFCLSPEYTE